MVRCSVSVVVYEILWYDDAVVCCCGMWYVAVVCGMVLCGYCCDNESEEGRGCLN